MRRYKRYRRRSSNVIKMRFQSFMDISTSADSMQIITISAGGKDIIRRLAPQFMAYKYYKIGKISVKLVPASTLPVDPTGLSIAEGDNLVDPRDQLTPGMMRITNGEDVFENISGLSDAEQHAIYNNMLLDPRWFKWMLQSGVRRYATPRYWQIGQLHQDKWPGAMVNVPAMHVQSDNWVISGTDHVASFIDDASTPTHNRVVVEGSSSHGMFQTGHRGVLGWLPTDGLQSIGDGLEKPFIASPVEVECMKILLPKAYKTRYWYRLFITETVYFKEPIVNFGIYDANGYSYRPLDVFHMSVIPSPYLPTQRQIDADRQPTGQQTGGNYGDN